jgi:hypothetical protein
MSLDGFELTPEDETILDTARERIAAEELGLSLEQFRALTAQQYYAILARKRGNDPVTPAEPDEVANYG